ncbi:hypothetical protein GCM10007161_05830 [Ignatzschineria indica]|nr:hypothetical protein GCM10007161_05830 [Ignatzschineria indica]
MSQKLENSYGIKPLTLPSTKGEDDENNGSIKKILNRADDHSFRRSTGECSSEAIVIVE